MKTVLRNIFVIVLILGGLVYCAPANRDVKYVAPQSNNLQCLADYRAAQSKKTHKYSYVTESGQTVIIPEQYVNLPAKNGLARFGLSRFYGKIGYLDADGEVVLPMEYDSAGDFADNGLAVVRIGRQFGYINAKGEFVIPLQYRNASSFNENGIAEVWKGRERIYINTKGEEVAAPPLSEVEKPTHRRAANHNLERVMRDGKYGFMNANGEMVISAIYTRANPFSDNGYAYVSIGYRSGFINTKGEEVEPLQYPFVGEFAENGLARMRQEPLRRYGFMNACGEVVMPPQFNFTRGFSENGLAAVQKRRGDKYGFINDTGEMVIPARYRRADGYWKNGKTKVLLEKNWIYIDDKGNMVGIATRY